MKRNKFNLSHYKIGSCDMGKLYPVSCFEVLPGDTIQMHTSVFLRFAPMVAPVMHPIKVSTYSFFVPLRLLWEDWEDFITGGPDGLDTSTPPTYTPSAAITTGSLADYLGVPVGYTGSYSAFPHRAYCKIYNEYFRDQDLVTEETAGNQTSGGNTNLTSTGGLILPVSWEKDYFTTCRPWPQKGATVTVPVNGAGNPTFNVVPQGVSAPLWKYVNYDGTESTSPQTLKRRFTDNADGGADSASQLNLYQEVSNYDDAVAISSLFPDLPTGNSATAYLAFADPKLKAELPSGGNLFANANVHLDDLREAFALQRFEEHRAMYGSRYTEYLRYLGVRARDSRLQRPEYLGGGKSTVQLSEVLQTAADGSNPVGTLRGHGIGVNRGRTFRRFIDEHGLVMTLMTIRPIAIYMNGLNKMFSREVKEDYWQRELEHIGQQEVLEKELYATGDTTSTVNDNSVFGYNNRYDEYRSVPSTVSGEMRSLLDYWHMARSFNNAPVLNSSFIQGTPTKRIFAEQTQDEIYFMASHSVVARRILSKMGNPIL